ncbi:MAG: tetratricopeptide repeat-containing sensor histidine kinase [Mucilaginibacter sp.]
MFFFLRSGVTAQQYNYNYDSLKQVITLHPSDTGSIRAYIDYASKFFYVKSNLGIYYLEKAEDLARTRPDNYLYLYCLKNKGDFYNLTGDFKTGSIIYKRAINIPSGPQAWLLKIKLKCNLGTAYRNMGMLDSARSIFEEVVKSFNIHEKNHRDSIALAFSLIQLFDIYKAQGLMDEALYYGDRGNALSIALKFDRGMGYGFYIQALKYQPSNQPLALSYCDKALTIAVEKKIPDLEQFASALKAKILISQKKYRQAEAVMLKEVRFTAGTAQEVTYAKLSEIYYYLDNLPKALSYFKWSYRLAKTSWYRGELAEALVNGIAVYERLKDYKNAFKLQKEYQQVQNEITSDKLKLDYKRSAMKYKASEKDRQLTQKQLQLAQKDNQLNRQSLLTFIAVFVMVLVIALWVLHNRQQKKLQQQQALATEAANEFHALEAMMKGEEVERQRIAKDLHDGIGGLLSAIKMSFSTLKNHHPELRNSESFKNVILMLDNASADVRKTAHNLMPDMLARFGLDEVVHLFCDQISQRNQMTVDYQTIGMIERYDDGFELVVYRIVLELLNNIIKHANARYVLVQLARHNDLLTISVEDDGVGFDVDTQAGVGIGLTSLKERVRYLKGILDIQSGRDKGTAVYMEFDVGKVIRNIEVI